MYALKELSENKKPDECTVHIKSSLTNNAYVFVFLYFTLCTSRAGADPGINYKGRGGEQEYEFNYKGWGVHKSIPLCNKVNETHLLCTGPPEGGAHAPYAPLGSTTTAEVLTI